MAVDAKGRFAVAIRYYYAGEEGESAPFIPSA